MWRRKAGGDADSRPRRAARRAEFPGIGCVARCSSSAAIVVAVALALQPAIGMAQAQDPPLSGARVAAQVGAAVVATPVGFLAGGVATEWIVERIGVEDPRASRIALAGAWAGAALATAAAPTIIGTRGRVTGSYWAALGGTLAGGAGSYLLVRLFDRSGDDPRPPCRIGCKLAAVSVFVLPGVGATVGFNASRRYEH